MEMMLISLALIPTGKDPRAKKKKSFRKRKAGNRMRLGNLDRWDKVQDRMRWRRKREEERTQSRMSD